MYFQGTSQGDRLFLPIDKNGNQNIYLIPLLIFLAEHYIHMNTLPVSVAIIWYWSSGLLVS